MKTQCTSSKTLSRCLIAMLAMLLATAIAPLSQKAYADDLGLTISPTNVELSLDANKTTTASFTVINNANESCPVRVYAAPFSVTDTSYSATQFNVPSASTKLADWIEFPQTVYRFAPHEQRTVDFKVKCPRGTAPGMQYAALFAQIDPSQDKTQSGITAVRRVGCLAYAKVAGAALLNGEATVAELPKWSFGGDITMLAQVANTGNVDFMASHAFIAHPLFAGQAHDSQNNETDQPKNVRTDMPRSISHTWVAPAPGIYQVTQLVNYANTFKCSEQTVIVCPLWLIIAAGAVVLLIVGATVFALRRRHKRNADQSIRPSLRKA